MSKSLETSATLGELIALTYCGVAGTFAITCLIFMQVNS